MRSSTRWCRSLDEMVSRERVAVEDSAAHDHAIVRNLQRVVHASEETLRLVVLCLIAEGHLIIEDLPGVGKTTLAKALSRSIDVDFSRLQFTPDLLPSTSRASTCSARRRTVRVPARPVFANLLLVDEINRASPKTQSALLECMQERQVTIDGVTYAIPAPFMVIATQNPIEYEAVPAARSAARPLRDARGDRVPDLDRRRGCSTNRRRGRRSTSWSR